MRVVTPGAVSRHTGSKYLGVLVAAKYARSLNEFRRGVLANEDPDASREREKLTTVALGSVASGGLDFQLTTRRRDGL